MGIIIKNKKDYYTKFIIWLFVIILGGLSPFIIGFIGAYLTELTTGEPCHGGNCFWEVIPWYGILTLPISLVILIIFLIIVIIDSIKLRNGKK
jgi:hypothetical protein|tara:strand:+ start:365 stop:643 length:279 start_codon:yes stop_codon:yes gene_type:complete